MRQPSKNKKSYVTKIAVILVILLAVFGYYIWTQKGGSFVTFSGTITARNNGCAYDDTCTISVDGKVIVTGGGLTADPNANIYGTTDNDLRIGDKVSVKARTTDQGLTLQGCQDCYITRGSIQR